MNNNQIQKINSKDDLVNLVKDKNALARLKDDKVEEFKTNFIELWSQKYLIQSAEPSELLDFCIQVTNIGLSVNPWHKEVYVLPFTQKGKSGKKLEVVYRKEAIEEMAFRAGMQIEADSIWNINGDGVLFSNMTYLDQSTIKSNNVKYINDNFIGFEIRFYDLKSNLRPQKFTISYDYLKYATNDNNIGSDQDQISKLIHKAYRKAFNMAFIPKGRDTRDKLNKLDNINYNDETIETVPTSDTTKKDLKSLSIDGVSKDINNFSVDDITLIWEDGDSKKRNKMLPLLVKGWKEYNQEQLNNLFKSVSEL